MYVQSFGSGSSGNALLIKANTTSVLIDCGLSPRTLVRALAQHGTTLNDLGAILLTHEHDDHVRGLAAARTANVPFVATEGTARSLGLESGSWHRMTFGSPLEVACLELTAIATSHDAAQPCGFSISDGNTRVTVLTDLGETDDACSQLVVDAQLIVIEANHDVAMLKSGPYPDHLKRRVLSKRGHLSNEDCGLYLRRCLGSNSAKKTIWLAHLSATNNRPKLAVSAVEGKVNATHKKHTVFALPRRDIGPIWRPLAEHSITQLEMFD